MDFKPLMLKPPVLMDPRIFAAGPMELRDQLLSIPLEERFTYDETTNHFFVNLERFALRNQADIEHLRQIVTDRVAPLGKRVYAIVNYDNFTIDPALLDEYSAMVRGLMDKYYAEVTRYTTSGFLRMKLGDALEKRGVAPHIYESAAEAKKSLQERREGVIPFDRGSDGWPSRSARAGRFRLAWSESRLDRRQRYSPWAWQFDHWL
jgi:propionate CoA-transferase